MRSFSLVAILAVTLMSCQESFKKGDDGLEYKIISKGDGAKAQQGNFIEMHVAQLYRTGRTDSLLNDSRESMPIIEVLDTTTLPKPYFNILSQLHAGDSLVIRVLSDSMFKQNPDMMPDFIKKGHYLITTVKLLNVYTSQDQADSARTKAMAKAQEMQEAKEKEHVKIDEDLLQAYFKKNNIKTVKSPLGVYVEIIEPGTGVQLDTSMIAVVNYTGKTLEGKAFDSNTDPTFNHPEPFHVNLTNDPALGQSVITGWKEGLLMLKKGSKAKFYIPSSLAYGARGAGNDIKPFSVLMFDIEIVDVQDKAQAKIRMEEEMKKRREAQQMQQLQMQMQQQMQQGQQQQGNPNP